ncbi:hypothetical protein GALMADRAFT_253980 [Galerina marginata CBS 339.88]|uniref:PIPK domain-containing protein n=1 Tax=Galerina marginata (strain CBS 339.88) TaxID=685588 RepID=A0A067SKY7_GALM3|nr:hypothetical protein GALMADRAFT_253980 [Galerina marginata CBS 339.88]
MADHKPLPALPASYALATLSVEARNHRGRLIQRFLSDIHEPGIQNRRDDWVYVFEEVLDELSYQLSRGDWLASVKRGKRKARSQGRSASEGKPPAVEAAANGDEAKALPSTPPLNQLQSLAARPALAESAGHLLLCVAPHGSRLPLPTEDSGFDILPANIGCSFSSGSFVLQNVEDEFENTILYGLSGFDALDDNLRLVGGTFTFKGVNSPMQHMLITKVLRLATYVHLALILEQHLLSNSGVKITFPLPQPKHHSTPKSPSTVAHPQTPSNDIRARPRNSIIPSSFTNFFLKRSFSQLSPGGERTRGSLDLTLIKPSISVDSATEPTVRKSFDGLSGAVNGLRLNRFSFMGERRSSIRNSTQAPQVTSAQPFLSAVKRIEDSKNLLSTSAGVTLPPPKLLVDLSEKEKGNAILPAIEGQKRRLTGDERVALTSLLGWDGKDAEGRGMTGILGFVRHQEISVLCSLHVPPSTKTSTSPSAPPIAPTNSTSSSPITADTKPIQDGSSAFTNATTSSATSTETMTTTASNLPTSGMSPCGKPHWKTYQYYSSTGGDIILGEWVQKLIERYKSPCDRSGCKFTMGEHETRVIHDGIRIVCRVAEVKKEGGAAKKKEKEETADEAEIEMWESCAVCNAKTPRTTMGDGTYLLSYAKCLELLIYSPALCVLTPALCEHTSPSPDTSTALSPSRFNIIRYFSTATGEISLALSTIEDIFELRVPRLQLTRGGEKASPPPESTSQNEDAGPDGERKKALRKEIRKWWEGVSDHIDKIEKVLNDEETGQKALPRLPSTDDAYDVFDTPDVSSSASTPTPSDILDLPPLPPSTPISPLKDTISQGSYFTTQSNVSTDTQASKTPTVPPKDDVEQLLATLRHNFQKIEQSLYVQLAKTPVGSLNDVRRTFLATGIGTQKRLKAWQKKHLGSSKSRAVGDLIAEAPEWWGKGCHAVPGGNIIVRENDWGSIIAHTLSTVDYRLELANLSAVRSASESLAASTPRVVAESGSSSFFSVATGYRLFTSSSKNQPDPDQEDVVWNEPEQFSAVISRKEHTRDPTSLLSIRDVLRQKTIPEQSNGSTSGSRLSSLSNSSGSQILSAKAPSVKSKADVGLSMQAADGVMDTPDKTESVETLLLQELDNSTPPPTTTSRPASIRSEAISSVVDSVVVDDDAHIRRVSAASVISAETAESKESQSTIGKNKQVEVSPEQPSDLPPPLPPKDAPKTDNHDVIAPSPSVPAPPPLSTTSNPELPPPPTSSRFANTLASGINTAMRYVLNAEPSTSSRLISSSPSSATKHHTLLADVSNFDDRPHIKYDWTIGKRLKFSCTVYYAKQFDMLRKRCGISDLFLKSLSTSTNWAAEGGKSKSNFWKTSDDRFIIKTLVDAWNVADLQVLVELAPSYFRYMDTTANRPTVLAKLIGFYTIEIRNLETGAVQSKADLLVMENLFFDQKISKTFDLKGIQGRKVKAHGDTIQTLFDGEWIEGQRRTLTLVRPHSKIILREAIKSDAEFLSKSNIMDYSLLLGVDNEKKEIVCGLVDTIGSYTFAKTLEYKAKQGLQSGKEVTVVPPTEYQDRFINALEGYFVACPDKWSKPLDESKIINDPNLLPSIL